MLKRFATVALLSAVVSVILGSPAFAQTAGQITECMQKINYPLPLFGMFTWLCLI
jgi:hypothetical protein